MGNETDTANQGAFSELIHLQTEFYTRLTEETLKYLRRLQAAASPASPGTLVMPETSTELQASGSPGQNIELQLEIENRQRVYCIVTPALTPLVHSSGATWFPSTPQASMLLAPEQVETIKIPLLLPAAIPHGLFRGALLLQGFRDNALPVCIAVTAPATTSAAATAVPSAPAAREAGEQTSPKEPEDRSPGAKTSREK